MRCAKTRIIMVALAIGCAASALSAEVIVAEGEKFKPLDRNGWKLTAQDDSYASHTYGGMWMTHGACLGAPADSENAVAIQTVAVPAAGAYRVWSKYQSPPYFNYLHRIEIVQSGRKVFSHIYGAADAHRLWSFGASGRQIWWPWGVDHDAAEAPPEMAQLAAGKAEIRLTTVPNRKPAGDRYVDFILLTTKPDDTYEGLTPYLVGSPFVLEALAATPLYMRFYNPSKTAARMKVAKVYCHLQPAYGGSSAEFPEKPVAPGEWSAWFNIGPFCRFVHDEGLYLTIPEAKSIRVQVARRADGRDQVGDVEATNGEAIVIPIDIAWRKGARVSTSKSQQEKVIAASLTWPKANSGKKPKEVLFFAHFPLEKMRDALGYNTGLPDGYDRAEHVEIVSFGDEIGLNNFGSVDFADAAVQARYRGWLTSKGITAADLGGDPAQAVPVHQGSARDVWYSRLFEEQQLIDIFQRRTRSAEEAAGKPVLTGANFSPHHGVLYYGDVAKWVDLFKNRGMSMFWTEDYIFSSPVPPQIISWQLATMRCAVKYHNLPMRYYVMPHSPGQEPGFVRRNALLAVGTGVRQIDNFCVAPMEGMTENYVSWRYPEMFRTLHDCIYESGEAESILATAKLRPARVAVIIGKATDFNESRLSIDKSRDPLISLCDNAPAQITQTLCRNDQQYLYLALRNAGYAVDLITEDDIAQDGILSNYSMVYFAGEWIDSRAVRKLDEWVRNGGILYATAGAGYLNEFAEPNPAMLGLLGLQSTSLRKNAISMRALLELPIAPQIDTISLTGGAKIPAVGMRQALAPDTAEVIGTWADGTPAVTVRSYGSGKAYTVGTLPGTAWMRSGVKAEPASRGGVRKAENPVGYSVATECLVMLGVGDARVDRDVLVSKRGIETVVADGNNGTMLTIVNWTNKPIRNVKVEVRMPEAPRVIRSVQSGKNLKWKYADGRTTFSTSVNDADFVLFEK